MGISYFSGMRYSLCCIFSVAAILSLNACKHRVGSNSNAQAISAANFVGPWQPSRVFIDLGKTSPEGTRNMVFDPETSAKSQGKKPVMTVFNADGSYREDTYTLADSLLATKSGFWHYQGDSLYMRLEGAGSKKNAFKATFAGPTLQLICKLDWNGDGLSDDRMQVELRRP